MLFGVLAVTSVAAGCGGADGSEPPVISKAAFTKRGSAICEATRQGIRSDFEAFTRGGGGREAGKAGELTPEETAARVGKEIIVPAMRQELAEFRALGVPPGDEAKVTALLNAFEEGVENAEEDPEGAATDGTEAFGESGRVADGYGLEGC